MLSPESCAEPGPWRTARFPYLAEIMDAFSRSSGCSIVFMKSSQVGATEVLNNFIGYIIDQDPGPTMVVQPTIEMAKAWSKDRLDPMLRDTPCLRVAVTDNQKDSDNTILHKRFADGHLTIVGANSAANLRSRPIRNVLLDEIDAYPPHLDSVGLAVGRAKGFANRRVYKASTPEIKGSSRIEAAFEASNMQYLFVPCPHCAAYQRLLWEQIRWQRELADGRRVPALDMAYRGRGRPLPETTVYVCEHCGAEIAPSEKTSMVTRGQWRATAPETGVEGFHLNELYSPLVSWQELVQSFVVAKKLPETLKKFINESLGLSWEEQADKHDPHALMNRREPYRKAPVGALLAGLSGDVQDDRIEIEVVGWGRMFESWSLDWRQFLGDTAFPEVWNELDEYLRRTFETEDGRQLPLAFSMIDSGHNSDMVYRFCKPRYRRHVFALKGVGGLGSGHPIVGRIKRENKYRCPVLPANVDECKNRLFGWLSLETAGPGYMHYPDNRDEEYFQQLTAEDRVERVQRGQKVRAYVQRRARNEALDLRVYNLVGIELLQPKWDALAQRAVRKIEPTHALPTKGEPMPPRRRIQRPMSNWMSR